MKYFLDTEFIEGTQKDLTAKTADYLIAIIFFLLAILSLTRIHPFYFGIPLLIIELAIGLLYLKKTIKEEGKIPTIDLISIGIVAEDGREYYAISKDFNLREAWNRYQMKQVSGDLRNRYPHGIKEYWIRENVLRNIFYDLVRESGNYLYDYDCDFTFKNLKYYLKKYGKTNNQIADEIKAFVYNKGYLLRNHEKVNLNRLGTERTKATIQFYGYYADYDWVVFCWLFGKMIDLPKGFPMYCRDLKQTMDEKAHSLNWMYGRDIWSNQNRSVHNIATTAHQEEDRPATFKEKLNVMKELIEYPKQKGEHNALADAKWNLELHKFLEQL